MNRAVYSSKGGEMGHVLNIILMRCVLRSQPFKRGETDELQYVRSHTLLRDFLSAFRNL
jgi:hypothetical protein